MLSIEKDYPEQTNVQKVRNLLCALGLQELVFYLEDKTDFFTAPASSKFHSNCVGGLVNHSYEVARSLVHLTDRLNLQWERCTSPYIIGLLHDVCKINTYKLITDETTKEKHWICDKYSDQHGFLSVKILEANGVKLTAEERICIKYHMGPWTKDINEDLGDLNYSQALKFCPNLLWVHTADMYASQILNI